MRCCRTQANKKSKALLEQELTNLEAKMEGAQKECTAKDH
jgi:hypothetical protein